MTDKLLVLNCSQCNCYSYPLRRCTRGKINPKTLKGAREAVQIFGLDYICGWAERGHHWKEIIFNETCEKMRRKADEVFKSQLQ